MARRWFTRAVWVYFSFFAETLLMRVNERSFVWFSIQCSFDSPKVLCQTRNEWFINFLFYLPEKKNRRQLNEVLTSGIDSYESTFYRWFSQGLYLFSREASLDFCEKKQTASAMEACENRHLLSISPAGALRSSSLGDFEWRNKNASRVSWSQLQFFIEILWAVDPIPLTLHINSTEPSTKTTQTADTSIGIVAVTARPATPSMRIPMKNMLAPFKKQQKVLLRRFCSSRAPVTRNRK